jgi:XTP/dITP diphosphohydrolase
MAREGEFMELVIATRNKKKIEEIKRITEGLEVKVLTLDDFPGCPDVEEDGRTFEENAVKKATAVADYAGVTALADDSGIEVKALNGAPGVFSARYAGEGADDTKNVLKLLKDLRDVEERVARFVCCLALAFPDGRVQTFFGYSGGALGIEQKGENGFGYDPIFYPEGYDRTFAEMSDEEKDSLSHRGKALQQFRQFLEQTKKLNY